MFIRGQQQHRKVQYAAAARCCGMLALTKYLYACIHKKPHTQYQGAASSCTTPCALRAADVQAKAASVAQAQGEAAAAHRASACSSCRTVRRWLQASRAAASSADPLGSRREAASLPRVSSLSASSAAAPQAMSSGPVLFTRVHPVLQCSMQNSWHYVRICANARVVASGCVMAARRQLVRRRLLPPQVPSGQCRLRSLDQPIILQINLKAMLYGIVNCGRTLGGAGGRARQRVAEALRDQRQGRAGAPGVQVQLDRAVHLAHGIKDRTSSSFLGGVWCFRG